MRTPLILGYNKDEGVVFIFAAYPRIMGRGVFLTLLFSLFRGSAWGVLKTYQGRIRHLEKTGGGGNKKPPIESFAPPRLDYRYVLAEILGDYLFACPARLLASHMGSGRAGAGGVRLYEFALPTRTPGFPPCEGLSCHTSELPYPFAHLPLIQTDYSTRRDGSGSADEKVSYAMSTYWVRMAYGQVNTPIAWEQAGDSDSSAEMCSPSWTWGADRLPAARHVDEMPGLPYWPEARGGARGGGIVYPNNIQGMKEEKEKRKRKTRKLGSGVNTRKKERDFFDDDDIEEFWGVGGGIPSSSEEMDSLLPPPPPPAPSTLLKMIFGLHVQVAEEDTDLDCICAFWNSLGYRF